MNGFLITGLQKNNSIALITSALMNILKEENDIISFNIGLESFNNKASQFILNSPSYKLDYSISKENTDYLFYSKLSNEKLAVVEGNIGIFNGYKNDLRNNGSPFQIAQRYNLPLIFIINSNDSFDDLELTLNRVNQLNYCITGIIINKSKSEDNIDNLLNFINKQTIPLLGIIDLDSIDQLDLSKLDLENSNEKLFFEELINNISSEIKNNINLEKVYEIIQNNIDEYEINNPYLNYLNNYKNIKVGIASDKAFHPYYQDNIELLKELGLKIVYFSPLKDKELPENIDFLYISSGDIFKYLKELEDNYILRHEINQRLNSGLPCLAENGGLLYLLNKIYYDDSSFHMVSFFNINSKISQDLKNLNYTKVFPSYPFSENLSINSKEFRNSDITENEMVSHIFLVKSGDENWLDGLKKKNTIAYFPYIHFFADKNGKDFLIQFLDLVKDENNN